MDPHAFSGLRNLEIKAVELAVVEFPYQRMHLRFVVDVADFYGNLIGSA